VTGFYPLHLKYFEIKLLYKKRDKNNIANYRPFSLLPSFSEIFESIMCVCVCVCVYICRIVLECTKNNNIVVKEQFGFRSKLLVDGASYGLISEINVL